MALTYTPAGELNSPMPEICLPDVNGAPYRSADHRAPATLVAFICNHCPYVKAIEGRVIELAREFKTAGLNTVAICSNDASEYPEDAPAALAARAREMDYPFTYLVDETQAVARRFGAVCTPDFFLYDAHHRLVYRGRLDDSWRDPRKVGRRELAEAVRRTLDGEPISAAQNPSMGCSIKWR